MLVHAHERSINSAKRYLRQREALLSRIVAKRNAYARARMNHHSAVRYQCVYLFLHLYLSDTSALARALAFARIAIKSGIRSCPKKRDQMLEQRTGASAESHGYQDLRSHHVGAKNMLESPMATRI